MPTAAERKTLHSARPTGIALPLSNTGLFPAVFFDRDGTLMEDADYCHAPSLVNVYPDAAWSLRRLRAAGFRLVVVTNQSGIGRGYFTETNYQRVQAEFFRQLGSPDLLDAVYHCPDTPFVHSPRRKPAPGMILEAARDLGLDLARSFIVGDKADDLACGRNAGLAGGVLVLTGKGREQAGKCQPDFTAENLTQAADWLLQRTAPSPHG